ncbi:MAG: DUF3137 domain-containing protein [Bacteroidota bacterium]
MLDPQKTYDLVRSDLENAEQFRLKCIRKLRPWKLGMYVIIAGTVIGLFFSAFFMLAPLVMILIVYLIMWSNELKKLKKFFQESVVSKIVQSMGSDFKYEAEGKIDESILKDCKLFLGFNRYKSEDLVTGTVDGNKIMHAEIDLKKHTKSSKSKSSTSQIFKGIFFVLYLKLKIPEPFYILSYAETKFIDRLSKFLPGINQDRGKRFDTGHEAFEKMFNVYTHSPDTTSKLLPAPILEQLIQVNQRFKDKKITQRDISFAFIDQRIYVAIPTRGIQNWMDPSLAEPINTKEFISRQLELVNEVYSLSSIF